MRNFLINHLCLVAVAISASTAMAQIPEASPEHKLLKADVGTWNAKVKMWAAGPDQPPQESEGKEVNKMLGDFWLVGEFEGVVAGFPFKGANATGYDPAQKKFVSYWVDSLTPTMMSSSGSYDKATKTFTYTMTGTEADGTPYQGKITTTVKDKDHRNMVMYMTIDGKDIKQMEIAYTRAK